MSTHAGTHTQTHTHPLIHTHTKNKMYKTVLSHNSICFYSTSIWHDRIIIIYFSNLSCFLLFFFFLTCVYTSKTHGHRHTEGHTQTYTASQVSKQCVVVLWIGESQLNSVVESRRTTTRWPEFIYWLLLLVCCWRWTGCQSWKTQVKPQRSRNEGHRWENIEKRPVVTHFRSVQPQRDGTEKLVLTIAKKTNVGQLVENAGINQWIYIFSYLIGDQFQAFEIHSNNSELFLTVKGAIY